MNESRYKKQATAAVSQSPGGTQLPGSKHSDHIRHTEMASAVCAASVSVQMMTSTHPGTFDHAYSLVNLAQPATTIHTVSHDTHELEVHDSDFTVAKNLPFLQILPTAAFPFLLQD